MSDQEQKTKPDGGASESTAMIEGEPLIHSPHTDVLDDDDPRAWKSVFCQCCGTMVHAGNNECMTTWLEWGPYILCGRCFAPMLADGVLELHEFVEIATSTVALGVMRPKKEMK